jgi:hypothetical protein
VEERLLEYEEKKRLKHIQAVQKLNMEARARAAKPRIVATQQEYSPSSADSVSVSEWVSEWGVRCSVVPHADNGTLLMGRCAPNSKPLSDSISTLNFNASSERVEKFWLRTLAAAQKPSRWGEPFLWNISGIIFLTLSVKPTINKTSERLARKSRPDHVPVEDMLEYHGKLYSYKQQVSELEHVLFVADWLID